jgi:hypothetical protein
MSGTSVAKCLIPGGVMQKSSEIVLRADQSSFSIQIPQLTTNPYPTLSCAQEKAGKAGRRLRISATRSSGVADTSMVIASAGASRSANWLASISGRMK